jgi:hypothetical protein
MRDDSHIQATLQEAAHYENIAAQRKTDAANLEMDTARERNRPFHLLRPAMFPDGNQWCALYGENLQAGVAGFGESPHLASIDFDVNWLNPGRFPHATTQEP